ncbi:MAG: DUF4892 domain-containing protein, partial [Dongiaceae bacterium]
MPISRVRACGLALISFLLFAVATGASPVRALEGDPIGAADHPLILRYEGAAIIGYDHRAFEQFRLPLGMPLREAAGSVELVEHRDIEGRHTRIIYAAPAERSSLEVFHNYERALTEDGFEILFTCSGDDCGERGLFAGELLYAPDKRLRTLGPVTEFAFSFPLQPFYLAARLPRDDGDIHVSLYVARENFDAFPETHNRALVLLDVIEPGTLEDRIDPNGGTDAMGVEATVLLGLESPPDTGWAGIAAAESDDIERALREAGRVAIYTIAFDSGKARLTEESYPAIGEIADVLNRNPNLSLFVVGHTDNEGSYQYNLNLSRQRAEAVV